MAKTQETCGGERLLQFLYLENSFFFFSNSHTVENTFENFSADLVFIKY